MACPDMVNITLSHRNLQLSLGQRLSLVLEAALSILAPVCTTDVSGEFLLLTKGSSKVGIEVGAETAFANHFGLRLVTLNEKHGASGGLD